MSNTILIIVLSGCGTFLLRWLPLWRARHHKRVGRASTIMQKWLAGVGPAAIAALFVVSSWGLMVEDARFTRIMMVALALGGTALTRWVCRGGVAIPTLMGALVYGLLVHWGIPSV